MPAGKKIIEEKLELPPQQKAHQLPRLKFKIPRLRWILVSIVTLVIVILVIDYLRYEIQPKPRMGQVINTQNEPIEGAIIVANGKAAESRSDGVFRIQARASDTLTITAIGYETQTVKGDKPIATLTPLKPASVRVLVVGPDNKELKKALVYRLDPNTSIPVDLKLTDAHGSAMFLDIPSGQAAFVVLQADYGVGWVETAVEPGGYARPIVQLQQVSGETNATQGFNRGLVNQVYAQGTKPTQAPTITPRLNLSNGQLVYEFTDVREVGENLYEITDKSITLITINFNQFSIAEYAQHIEILEREKSLLGQKGLDAAAANRLKEILEQQGVSSHLRTYRITPQWQDVSNIYVEQFDGKFFEYNPLTDKAEEAIGMQPSEVYITKSDVYRVQVQNPNSQDVMAFLQRQHWAHKQTQLHTLDNYVATSWSEIPAAEAFVANTGGIVIFDDPRRTVCCRGPEGDSGGDGTILSETSSVNTPASAISIRDINSDKPSFTYTPYKNELKPDLNAFEQIKQDNPNLEFADTDGATISILDIAPPHPDDAPTDFLIDFFDTTSQARDAFKAGSADYQTSWNNYLYMKANNMLVTGEQNPLDLYKDLRGKIGFDSGFRLNPESYAETASQESGASSDSTDSTENTSSATSSDLSATEDDSNNTSLDLEQEEDTGDETQPVEEPETNQPPSPGENSSPRDYQGGSGAAPATQSR